MCIAKGIIVNVREYDMVEGEMLGGKEFGVFVEEIERNFERCRIRDKSIHCLVRWLINELVDNEGKILRVNENFKEAPKEMAVWDLIEDTSPLNTWDGDLYNEKDLDSMLCMKRGHIKVLNELWLQKKLETLKYKEMKRKKSDFWQRINVANKIVFNMWI